MAIPPTTTMPPNDVCPPSLLSSTSPPFVPPAGSLTPFSPPRLQSDPSQSPKGKTPRTIDIPPPALSSSASQKTTAQAYGYGGRFSPSVSDRPIQRPRQRGGRRSATAPTRGNGFTQKEVENVLSLIEKHLPLCKEEWDIVAKEHAATFIDENRTVDSIKRKFATLHRRKIPTGDPRMPDDVRRAKHLRYRMCERADTGDGAEAEDAIDGILPNSDEGVDCGIDSDENDTCSTSPPDVYCMPNTPNNTPAENEDPPQTLAAPPPIVFKRPSTSRSRHRATEDEGENFYALFKMSLLQEQQRREEDMRRRQEEREEERKRRQDESARHQQLMEMMTMIVPQNTRGKDS